MGVYDNPKYYEIAFSFRDIVAEVDFLEKLIARYSKVPVKVFLELASGNSPHFEELCRRGYQYAGLELNRKMINYAQSKIKKGNLSGEIIEGDMVKFTVKEPVDCILVFLGSLYVKNDKDLESHLNSVARSLKSGGLYILDGVVSFYPEDVHTQSWEAYKDNVKVDVTYKATYIDKKENLVNGTITLNVKDDGIVNKIKHSEVRKVYSASEFITMAERTGFWENVGSFSNFDINSQPKEGTRNILVLRRK